MLNRHLLGYMPVHIAQAVVGFGGVIVFTRLLDPADYGRYTLILAAMLLAETALFTWLNAAVMRYHARSASRGRLAGHLATVFIAYGAVAGTALAALAAVIWLAPLDGPVKTAACFALAALIFRSALNVGLETRRAAGEVRRYALVESLTLSGGFALGAGFVAAGGMGSAGPFAGIALASAMACAFDLPIMLGRARRDRAGGRRARAFFAYGAPVAFSVIFEQLLSTGDRFMIAAFLGEAATGAYAAGYGITDRSLSILFVWLGAAAAPLAVSALEHRGRAAAREVMRQAGALMGLLGFPAAVGLAIVSEPFARLLIAEPLAGAAASIMGWIALGSLLNGIMTYFFHESFILGRKPMRMAALMVAGASVNMGLNLIMIPSYGLVGAAIATVIAYAVTLTACAVAGHRVFALAWPIRDWVKAALGAAAMAGVLLALPAPSDPLAHLAGHIAAGIGVYAALALMLDIAQCRSAMLAPLLVRAATGLRP